MKTKKAIPTLKGEPKFLYTSECCGQKASKTPCVKVDKKTAETQVWVLSAALAAGKPANAGGPKIHLTRQEKSDEGAGEPHGCGAEIPLSPLAGRG